MIIKLILLHIFPSNFPRIAPLSFHHRDHQQPGMYYIDFIRTPMSSRSFPFELSDASQDLISQDTKL